MVEKVFIFGLDRAGKSVITHYLMTNEVDLNLKPTLAFQQKMLLLPKLKINLWDTPGQIKFRKLWYKNVADSKVLVFILDTSDSNRFQEAKTELDDFIKGCYNLRAPLLFCFHQMDKPEAQTNLEKAKAFFDLGNIHIQKVHSMETQIKDTTTLNALREKIEALLIERQLQDEQIDRERAQKAEELKKNK